MNINVTATITPAELINRGLWDQACDLLGLHPWVVAEGQMDSDSPIILEPDIALELGLLPAALEAMEKHRQRAAALDRDRARFVEELDEWTARHGGEPADPRRNYR